MQRSFSFHSEGGFFSIIIVVGEVVVAVVVIIFHTHLLISAFSTTKEWDSTYHSKLGIKHLKTNLAHSLPDENGFIILVLRTHKIIHELRY